MRPSTTKILLDEIDFDGLEPTLQDGIKIRKKGKKRGCPLFVTAPPSFCRLGRTRFRICLSFRDGPLARGIYFPAQIELELLTARYEFDRNAIRPVARRYGMHLQQACIDAALAHGGSVVLSVPDRQGTPRPRVLATYTIGDESYCVFLPPRAAYHYLVW
jgi:hypothetical protein